jgi:hypothetical protein
MLRNHLLKALTLATFCTACATKQAPTLTYPAAVVAAQQQQHYRTALWCLYHSGYVPALAHGAAPPQAT